MFEDDNNHQIDVLSDQVNMLKQMSIDIGVEVSDQNRLLDGMDENIDHTDGLLGSTLDRLNDLGSTGTRQQMFALVLFVVLGFLVLYKLLSLKG